MNLIKSITIVTSLIVLSACGSANTTATDNSTPNAPTSENNHQITPLKILDGQDSSLNHVNAVNVNVKNPTFDYSYFAHNDQKLTLKLPTSSIILIGCEDKDIGYDFNIYSTYPDGNIDERRNLGLGYSPTAISGGQKYIVRVKLTLKKPCLGIAFDFGVLVTHYFF